FIPCAAGKPERSNMSQQIAKAESASVIQAFATDLATIHAAMSTNIGADGLSEFDLPRIRIPAGGGLQWVVPSLEGETSEAVIEGVIVLARDTRAYYAQPLGESGGNQPPDCSSSDAVTGVGEPGGNCLRCPFAQYGSARDGHGQACKQIKQLFVLRGSLLLPEVISLPPTSLKAAKQYLLKLTSQGFPYFSVVSCRDGCYYIMDGRHRFEALKRWLGTGWEEQQIQCWVATGLTEKEEA